MGTTVPDESRAPALTGPELVASFQVLELVGDAIQKVLDGADASTVRSSINAVKDRFDKCEMTLDRLAGGSLTRRDQVAEIRRLNDELGRKRALVRRYAEHDVVARVLKQGKAEEDEDAEGGGEDAMMKMDSDGFGEVGDMDKDAVEEDVLMGLEI